LFVFASKENENSVTLEAEHLSEFTNHRFYSVYIRITPHSFDRRRTTVSSRLWSDSVATASVTVTLPTTTRYRTWLAATVDMLTTVKNTKFSQTNHKVPSKFLTKIAVPRKTNSLHHSAYYAAINADAIVRRI